MSLYETSWTLRLRRELEVPTSSVVKKRVATELHSLIARSSIRTPLDLQTIALAGQTLKDLGIHDPKFASRVALLGENGSADKPGGPVSATATAIVVRALRQNNDTVPLQTVARLRQMAGTLSPRASLQQLTDTQLPILDALSAVESPASLHQNVPGLPLLLKTWTKTVLAYPASGVLLGDLVALQRIARLSGTDFTTSAASYARPLEVGKTGYYALSPGGTADAQVTANAAALGLLGDRDAAARTSSAGLGAQGWVRLSSPNALSTLLATEVYKLCHRALPNISDAVQQGLRTVTDRSNLRDIQIWVELARTYRVPMSDSLTKTLAIVSKRQLAQAEEDKNCLTAAQAFNLNPVNDQPKLFHSLPRRCGTAVSSLPQAVAYAELSSKFDKKQSSNAAREIERYQESEGWLLNGSQRVPDLVSTALAVLVTNIPSARRKKLLQGFARFDSWSFAPASFNSRQTSLFSVYAAVLLADGESSPNVLLGLL
jgi:hypothetical protein